MSRAVLLEAVRVLIIMTRAAIEEEYSNRLIALAKTTLGKDEIGFVVCPFIRNSIADGFYSES